MGSDRGATIALRPARGRTSRPKWPLPTSPAEARTSRLRAVGAANTSPAVPHRFRAELYAVLSNSPSLAERRGCLTHSREWGPVRNWSGHAACLHAAAADERQNRARRGEAAGRAETSA